MKKCLPVLALGILSIAGCGKLSDSDKVIASKGVNALSSFAMANDRMMRQLAYETYYDMRSVSRTCSPVASKASGVYTIKVECPTGSTGATKVTITSSSEQKSTCSGTELTLANVSAIFTIAQTGNIISFSGDLSADLNTKKLACKYASSLDVSTNKATVSDDLYTCTYDGSNLDKEAIQTNSCTTT